MIKVELLKQLLIIAITVSVITVAFIQKTKGIFKSSKWIGMYSAVVNIILAILFCITFTDISIANSLWVGLFGFIGADTIYKSFEGKLQSFSKLTEDNEEIIEIKRDDI